MKYFYPEGQFAVAMYFALVGCGLCMLYDIFRIKREFFGSSGIVLFVDDLLYTVICAFCTVLGILRINSGNVRWYETFFALSGFVLYRITLSRLFTGFFFFLSRLVKRLFSVVISFIFKVICPVMKPVRCLVVFVKTHINECILKIKLFNYKISFLRKLRKVSLKTGENK